MPSPSPTTVPAETAFDPMVFWIQNRTRILMLIGVFAVALAAYGISELARNHKLDAAAEAFSTAKTPDDLKKLISNYSGTPVAGSAHLLLADQLRNEGKIDESTTVLRSFIEKYPKHEFISGAWMSLAANQEAQGKADEALATYQKISTSYSSSFSAPTALMAQARILKAKGKSEEARRIYEQVITQFPDNIVSQQAAVENRLIKK